MVGITEESLIFGQRHNKGFFNPFVNSILKNSNIKPKTKLEACTEWVNKIALVNIEVTSHDVISITRIVRRNIVKELAVIGMDGKFPQL